MIRFSTLPLIASSNTIRGSLEKVLPLALAGTELVHLTTPKAALDYLNLNLPDIFFLDISDKEFDAFAFLDECLRDPWLLHGGIIAFASDYADVKRLESYTGANLLIILQYEDISRHLPKVLKILAENSGIVIQRSIGTDLISNLSGSFVMENDPIEVVCYTNLLCNFLFNTGRIDKAAKPRINVALTELLLNAIEHGNCGITYEEKSTWLDSGKPIIDLIAERARLPEIACKKTTLEFSIEESHSDFTIEDEGEGFDWRAQKEISVEEALFALHGRGIVMAKSFTSSLLYNEKGNRVSFTVDHTAQDPTLAPSIFKNSETDPFAIGEKVFDAGDESNYLYYIVKGRYSVQVDGREVSVLTPNDIFMGEMSFLLNDRRSATVIAMTPGVLKKISKSDFIAAIRTNPHYSLLLSRLLAQRISRLNRHTATVSV